ncbi:hypothetical protein D3C84_665170 [compost metagenome]
MHEAVAPGLQLRAQWYRRFAHEEGSQQRRDHQRAEEQVSTGPGRVFVIEAGGAEAFSEEQRAGRGQQRRDSITGHVAGGQGGLSIVFGDFQAIGVNRDILRRRGECDDHRDGDQPGQMFLRVAETHANQAENHQDLGKHQPGASSTQLAEQRQAPLVEQR